MSADSKHPSSGGAQAKSSQLAEEPYDLIKDASQIIRYIEKALIDEENVEITINDRTRIYFSYFMDHVPEPIEPVQISPTPGGGEAAAPAPEISYPPYKACTYLFEKKYLLMAPLSPAMGNALIRNSHDVDLRFFQGVKSLELTVRFEGTLMVRGEPAIQLSFPKEMRMIRKRRHYRAPYSDVVDLQVTIIKGKEVIPVRLVDISVGGLGFCTSSQDPEEFPIGSLVKVELNSPDHEKTLVNAYIRSVGRAGQKDGCPRGDGKVGLQFDLPNETMAMRIEEIVAYLQREYLQCSQEKKKQPKAPPRSQPTEEKKSIKDGLGKLLGMKKKWTFS